jgi:hypothetical protein
MGEYFLNTPAAFLCGQYERHLQVGPQLFSEFIYNQMGFAYIKYILLAVFT